MTAILLSVVRLLLLYLCWLLVLQSEMDDSGHRENGRHKADQYKSAQGQVLYEDDIDSAIITLSLHWVDFDLICLNLSCAVDDAASAINEADNGNYGR